MTAKPVFILETHSISSAFHTDAVACVCVAHTHTVLKAHKIGMTSCFPNISASFPLNCFLLFIQKQSASWDIQSLESLRTGSPEILPNSRQS